MAVRENNTLLYERGRRENSSNRDTNQVVSDYAKEKGYLDYKTLAHMLEDLILNNTIREATLGEWEIVAGNFDKMVMQDFIISRYGYEILKDYTNELVFYNDNLGIYIWAVCHWGTSWDYELTRTKLEVM